MFRLLLLIYRKSRIFYAFIDISFDDTYLIFFFLITLGLIVVRLDLEDKVINYCLNYSILIFDSDNFLTLLNSDSSSSFVFKSKLDCKL